MLSLLKKLPLSEINFIIRHYQTVIIILFIYLFIFGCVGSSLMCAGFLSTCGEWGLHFVVVRGLLTVVASVCCGAWALGARAQ